MHEQLCSVIYRFLHNFKVKSSMLGSLCEGDKKDHNVKNDSRKKNEIVFIT